MDYNLQWVNGNNETERHCRTSGHQIMFIGYCKGKKLLPTVEGRPLSSTCINAESIVWEPKQSNTTRSTLMGPNKTASIRNCVCVYLGESIRLASSI